MEHLLRERLGSLAPLVMQYLDRPAAQRNKMSVRNLALASIRFDVSPTAAAALSSGFLQDLTLAAISHLTWYTWSVILTSYEEPDKVSWYLPGALARETTKVQR